MSEDDYSDFLIPPLRDKTCANHLKPRLTMFEITNAHLGIIAGYHAVFIRALQEFPASLAVFAPREIGVRGVSVFHSTATLTAIMGFDTLIVYNYPSSVVCHFILLKLDYHLSNSSWMLITPSLIVPIAGVDFNPSSMMVLISALIERLFFSARVTSASNRSGFILSG
jgi:hypothetical protein